MLPPLSVAVTRYSKELPLARVPIYWVAVGVVRAMGLKIPPFKLLSKVYFVMVLPAEAVPDQVVSTGIVVVAMILLTIILDTGGVTVGSVMLKV